MRYPVLKAYLFLTKVTAFAMPLVFAWAAYEIDRTNEWLARLLGLPYAPGPDLPIIMVGLITGAIYGFVQYAGAELIEVFVDIEANTRRTADNTERPDPPARRDLWAD